MQSIPLPYKVPNENIYDFVFKPKNTFMKRTEKVDKLFTILDDYFFTILLLMFPILVFNEKRRKQFKKKFLCFESEHAGFVSAQMLKLIRRKLFFTFFFLAEKVSSFRFLLMKHLKYGNLKKYDKEKKTQREILFSG